jgi:hypothetical protein
LSSYDATSIIADAIKSEVAHPLGSMRFLPQSDEEVALAIINALEDAGFKIVKRDGPEALR